MSKSVWKIVITGGPIGGKSKAIKVVKKRLCEMGYRVFVIDEIATKLFSGAFPDVGKIHERDFGLYCKIQETILLRCLNEIKEHESDAGLMPREKFVLLLDRGPMDTAAYMPREYFNAMLEQNRLSLCDVRDNFDGVIHMVSTADGAEEVWQKAMEERQNNARWETSLEQAKDLDKRTRQVWIGTPHLRVIDNSTDFDGKVERLWKAVLHIIEQWEIERKFLLWCEPDFSRADIHEEKVEIEQIYLLGGERIRKRTPARSEFSLYFVSQKRGLGIARYEKEEQISTLDYLSLMAQKDSDTVAIKKNRYCFVFHNTYYEYDEFIEPRKGLRLMEVELESEEEEVAIPPFALVRKEVTNDPLYSNYEIAKIK